MKIEIRNRYTGSIIISGDYESVRECLKKNTGAYLRGAYLGGADLRGAYLTGAYLGDAYLTGAYLRGADLTDADLRGAYLRGANLDKITGYSQSHQVFMEAVRRQKPSVFTDTEWAAIGEISIHLPCWATIKKRFSEVMPHIFEILAAAGFPEWLDYWKEITK